MLESMPPSSRPWIVVEREPEVRVMILDPRVSNGDEWCELMDRADAIYHRVATGDGQGGR